MSSQWECSCLNMWVKPEVVISDCLVLCSCLVYLRLTLGFWFQVGSHSCRQGDSGSRGKNPPSPLFELESAHSAVIIPKSKLWDISVIALSLSSLFLCESTFVAIISWFSQHLFKGLGLSVCMRGGRETGLGGFSNSFNTAAKLIVLLFLLKKNLHDKTRNHVDVCIIYQR